MKKYLPTYSGCFVCGKDNAAGIKHRFIVDGGDVIAKIMFREEYEGFKGIVHGGIVTAIIDEAMGWASTINTKLMYVTAELNVRFLKPVLVNHDLTFRGSMTKISKGITFNEGVVIDSKGVILVKASGKFFPLNETKTRQVIDYLSFEEDTKNVFL